MVAEQIRRSQIARRAAAIEEQRREAPGCTIVTISRGLGTGGTEIAHVVAERLGWSLWDKKLVEAIAEDAHVRTRVVEHFDEKTVSAIETLAHALAGDYEVGNFLYRRHLARALLSIAQVGHAVILGRGAQYLLRDALHVRVLASWDFRVRRLMDEGMTREQAEEEIRRTDRERAAFVRQLFDKDIDDPTDYDLVIKTDSFGIQGAADVILAAIGVRCRMPATTP